jgi:hypothetical protein
MKVNQLHRCVVGVDDVNLLCACIGLRDINDGRSFTRAELLRRGAVQRLLESGLLPRLRAAYLPCKAYYLDAVEGAGPATARGGNPWGPELALLTIVRQLLRLHHRRLVTSEHTLAGKRIMQYHIRRAGESAVHVTRGPVIVDMQ